jgi:hypothetical protein
MAIVFLLRWLAASQGIRLPFIGYVSPLIASFIIVPILLVPLTALNQYVLKWRKTKGRDIEAEERHEFDEADIISLRPQQPHEYSSTYRRGVMTIEARCITRACSGLARAVAIFATPDN